MPEATITTKGQVTIPRDVRRRLHLEAGDKLLFEPVEDGESVLVRVIRTPQPSLAGSLRHLAPAQPLSVEEMDRAIRARVAARRK